MTGRFKRKLLYDTFISYHESDKKWVTENLIQYLEDNHFIVCWDDRDFEPGRTVIENKLTALCSSACTVVVLSPEYVKDEVLWSVLQDSCGVDKEQLLDELSLIPVLFRPCSIPEIFQPLWKLDWTNKSVKKFFWEKLAKTVGKFAQGENELLPKFEESPAESSEDSGFYPQKESDIPEDYELHKDQELVELEVAQSNDLEIFYDDEETSQEISPSISVPDRTVKDLGLVCETEPERSDDQNVHNENSEHRNSLKLEESQTFEESHQQSPCDQDNKQGIVLTAIDESEDNIETQNTFLEKMNPRILSFFVPEDDDLTREDVEELTFKIEDVSLQDHLQSFDEDYDQTEIHKALIPNRSYAKHKKRKCDTFQSQQEQILVLDFLQEKYLKIKRKFEDCHDFDRKRIYRRLLKRFDQAICSTVNGEKDSCLLSSLPTSDLSLNEDRGFSCSCCDQLFHSDRALHLHTADCVKKAWDQILTDPFYKIRK